MTEREEREWHMRGAVVAEHVYVEPDPESEDRHILFHGRRVGKLVWKAEELRWELLLAAPDGGYVSGRSSYDAEPDDPERIDRLASGDVAFALANDMHPLGEELL